MKEKIFEKLKNHKILLTLLAFVVVALAVILVATLLMKEFIVPVCILIIIETAIAAFLRKSELWLHAVVLLVQLLVGFLFGRLPMMALCVLIYVAATIALMFIYKEDSLTAQEESKADVTE